LFVAVGVNMKKSVRDMVNDINDQDGEGDRNGTDQEIVQNSGAGRRSSKITKEVAAMSQVKS
jgi:hypothetical protein